MPRRSFGQREAIRHARFGQVRRRVIGPIIKRIDAEELLRKLIDGIDSSANVGAGQDDAIARGRSRAGAGHGLDVQALPPGGPVHLLGSKALQGNPDDGRTGFAGVVYDLGALAEDTLKVVRKVGCGALERSGLAGVDEDGGRGIHHDTAERGREKSEQDERVDVAKHFRMKTSWAILAGWTGSSQAFGYLGAARSLQETCGPRSVLPQ